MLLEVFPSGPFATNAILLASLVQRKGVFIDPAPESGKLLLKAAKAHHLEIIAIFLTHSHWDHFSDVAFLKKEIHVPVYVHREDQGNVEHPGSDRLPLFLPIEGVKCDILLEGGELLEVGDLTIEVIHTPGHTPGGVAFYLKKEGILISGDTLFKGTMGNISFPTANKEKMWQSLKKLSTLPPETKVYPGHGDPTTIGAEKWLKDPDQLFKSSRNY
ncbi:MAG: MBL fold metallo-hydrolase [Simkania negevensis]|nr:MBL fold metallo-hydrolase [Simkania negevensis]